MLSEDLSTGDSLSTPRNCSEEVREGLGYTGVFATKQGNPNIKRLLLIKANQTSQGTEFSTFFMYGKIRESELTEIAPLIGTV